MNFRPVGNNVLLEPEPFAEQSGAGVWLPQPKRQQGHVRAAKVLAVGPGKRCEDGSRVPPEMRAGDRVIYLNFKGQDAYAGPGKYAPEKLLLLDADDILAVVPEGEAIL